MEKRLGFCFLTFADISFEAIGDVTKYAEENGFDRAYTTESLTDTFAINMVMAMKTTTIEVGSFIAIIYLRHPYITAQAATTLSDISNGRFILGLGLGHPPRNAAMNIKTGKPTVDLRNYVSEVKGLLKGENVYPDLPVQTYQGKVLGFKKPRNDIPVFTAAVGPRMTKLSGEISDGIMLYMVPQSRIKKLVNLKNEGALEKKRDPLSVKVDLGIHTFFSEDLQLARDKARETRTYWLGLPAYIRSIRESGFVKEADLISKAFHENDQKGISSNITDELIDQFCLVGPRNRCLEKLDGLRSEGVDLPVLMIDPVEAGESYEGALRRTISGLSPK